MSIVNTEHAIQEACQGSVTEIYGRVRSLLKNITRVNNSESSKTGYKAWVLFLNEDITNEHNGSGPDTSKQIKIEYNVVEKASPR